MAVPSSGDLLSVGLIMNTYLADTENRLSPAAASFVVVRCAGRGAPPLLSLFFFTLCPFLLEIDACFLASRSHSPRFFPQRAGMDQAFAGIRQALPDTKLYPYGFTPSFYSWEVRFFHALWDEGVAPLSAAANAHPVRTSSLAATQTDHYGDNFSTLEKMKRRFNGRRTIGSGVDIFGPRL